LAFWHALLSTELADDWCCCGSGDRRAGALLGGGIGLVVDGWLVVLLLRQW
jgi:hypothetical protein